MSVKNTVDVAQFSANLTVAPQASATDHIRVQILLQQWPEQPEWFPQP